MTIEERRPRGRPRPLETIERDHLVLACLRTDGDKTRNQIAEELGLDRTRTWLSLDRLRRDGLVRVRGYGAGSVWTVNLEDE